MSRPPPTLNLAGIAGGHEGCSSERGSPISSRGKKPPATSRFAFEESAKTPRSSSCDVVSSSYSQASAKRSNCCAHHSSGSHSLFGLAGKDRSAKADGETPRSAGNKKPLKTQAVGCLVPTQVAVAGVGLARILHHRTPKMALLRTPLRLTPQRLLVDKPLALPSPCTSPPCWVDSAYDSLTGALCSLVRGQPMRGR